jgi:Flp pilus assembly pilin Flp
MIGGNRLIRNWVRSVQTRLNLLIADESGMSTVEYAIGTIAAAAFGAILYSVVTGDSIVSALTNIINRALNTNV